MSSPPKTLTVPDPEATYRVVQWATGKVGSSSTRAIVRHPQLALVGLHVYNEEKEGRDAGELTGLEPVGITATRSIDDVIALDPDCVLYMQEGCDFDDVCRLLSSGINIVSTRGEFQNPKTMDPEVRQRVEDACHRGGTSIHSTGSSPGFITEAVPLVLTSLSRRLDCLTIDEYADIANSCSDFMIFDLMGYGQPHKGEMNPLMVEHLKGDFGRSLRVLADALGVRLDAVQGTGETATAPKPIVTPGGRVIETGTVAAMRATISGIHDGRPLLRMRLNWYCSLDLDVDWELRDSGWRVQVEGDTPLDVEMRLPRTSEDFDIHMAGYTAHRAVNSVPYVCAAAPGIRTTFELPQVAARLG